MKVRYIKKMSELKTLKDLESYADDTNYPSMIDLVSKSDLKAEAIKWFKRHDVKEDANNQLLWFIQHFFNIKEEDLDPLYESTMKKKFLLWEDLKDGN